MSLPIKKWKQQSLHNQMKITFLTFKIIFLRIIMIHIIIKWRGIGYVCCRQFKKMKKIHDFSNLVFSASAVLFLHIKLPVWKFSRPFFQRQSLSGFRTRDFNVDEVCKNADKGEALDIDRKKIGYHIKCKYRHVFVLQNINRNSTSKNKIPGFDFVLTLQFSIQMFVSRRWNLAVAIMMV